MEEKERRDSSTRLVVDETTIYEVDMDCYRCLSEREREEYFGTDLLGYHRQKYPFQR
ncbi:MAG: hypothetical protein J1F22_07750 [Lachnospiraceae bacterium]|nr:hypothetical protein [Lachnospiraceae bacterium]